MKVPKRAWAWIDDRLGWSDVILPIVTHPVPRVNWWYVLGSATLIAFVVQVVTGVALAFTYVPAPNSAYESLDFITNRAIFGNVVRGLHYWGSSAMVVLAFAHLARTDKMLQADDGIAGTQMPQSAPELKNASAWIDADRFKKLFHIALRTGKYVDHAGNTIRCDAGLVQGLFRQFDARVVDTRQGGADAAGMSPFVIAEAFAQTKRMLDAVLGREQRRIAAISFFQVRQRTRGQTQYPRKTAAAG